MEIVTVSSRGQLVIPEKVREKYKIKEGTKMILIEQDDRIILEKEEKISKILNKKDLEEKGWNLLAEESLKEVWGNEKDEKTWTKYL